MNKDLPIYDVVIDPNEELMGVHTISLVDEPAINVYWTTLSEQTNFKANKDKQELWGPILIPDILIYRKPTKTLPECYIRFTKEQIELIANKFNEDLNGTSINLMHENIEVNGFVSQNWIIDENDKSKSKGFNLPVGTWFGVIKIKNEDFWKNEIKSENVKGFSVEINHDFKEVKLETQEFIKPKEGETKDEYISKCIAYVVDEGKTKEEAIAQCMSEWENHLKSEEEGAKELLTLIIQLTDLLKK